MSSGAVGLMNLCTQKKTISSQLVFLETLARHPRKEDKEKTKHQRRMRTRVGSLRVKTRSRSPAAQDCSLSMSSVLSGSGGQRSRSSSNIWFVDNWPSCKASACALMPSDTSRMRFSASRSMPGASGLTVALETADGVGDMGARRAASVEVQERYSPDEGGPAIRVRKGPG
jgi:hypothetical protein